MEKNFKLNPEPKNQKLFDLVKFEFKIEGKSDLRNIIIKGISDNSYEIEPGFIFFAINGNNFHGANFSKEAIKNGAKIIVSDKEGIKIINSLNIDVCLLEVKNVRSSLSICASNWFKGQPKNIIAVTGTNGKTSVCNFVRQIWDNISLKGVSIGTLGIQGHFEERINLTTPGPIELHKLLAFLKQKGIENVVFEASSHGISQNRLDNVKINTAVFTNFSRDHLDYHKNELNYLVAKAGLFEFILPKDAVSIINIDANYGPFMKLISEGNSQNVLTLGQTFESDLKILSIKALENKQLVKFSFRNRVYTETLNLIGSFQIFNALMSALTVISQGINEEKVFENLKFLKNIPGRMEYVGKRKNGGSVYVDFAHTPEALYCALKALRSHTFGKLIVLFGAGGERDVGKRSLMGKVAYENSDKVYITDDNPRNENPRIIRSQIIKSCPGAIEISDRSEAILQAVEVLSEGDILLIAGKGHERGQEIKNVTYPFYDVEQASISILALEGAKS